MPKINFSDSNLRAINVTKTTWFSDSSRKAMRGLRLMAGATRKTWFYNRRIGDKSHQVKLGHFPQMNFERAKIAATASILPAPGPAPDPAPTLRENLEAYIEHRQGAGKLSDTSAAYYRDLFRVHASDWLDAPYSELTTYSVEERFNSLSGVPGIANKVVTILRSINKYATRHDEIKRDPTSAVTALHTLRPKTVRCKDLATVMADVLSVANPVKKAAWLLLLHTGLRSSNLRSLRWGTIGDEGNVVDLEKGSVFISRLKNGEAREFPLSDYALSVFKSLRKFDDTFCFPSFRCSGPIDHLDALPNSNQHDMRRHFSSAATRAGVERDVRMYLRGDLTKEAAIDHYSYNLGTREAVNRISERINKESGVGADYR